MLHDIWLAMLQLPNFNSLAFVSLVAAVMSVTYSTIGWTTAVADGRIPGGWVHDIISSCKDVQAFTAACL
jgi:hypothetical protein